MAKGGKQPGAGRPKGSTNVPRFADYITEEDRKTFVEFMLANYMADMRVAAWVGEHLFLKPRQELSGIDGGPIQIEGVDISIRK